jgi:hypothetical protein
MGWYNAGLTGGGGPETGWETAGTIVNQAGTELGLIANTSDWYDTTDPFASNDKNMVLLCRLVTTVGRELVDAFDWRQLRRQYSFWTTAGIYQYPLPAGFRSLVNQASWNRTNRLPLGGPLSSQQWQYLASRQTGLVINVLFRLGGPGGPGALVAGGGLIELFPETNTPGGVNITFEYQSSFWVGPYDGLTYSPYRDALTAQNGAGGAYPMVSQIIYFDSLLMVRLLKLRWLQARGFDSAMAEQQYRETLARCKDNDSESPVLDLNGDGQVDPLLGPQNFPFTGYGNS